jgi:hypothetical protein
MAFEQVKSNSLHKRPAALLESIFGRRGVRGEPIWGMHRVRASTLRIRGAQRYRETAISGAGFIKKRQS